MISEVEGDHRIGLGLQVWENGVEVWEEGECPCLMRIKCSTRNVYLLSKFPECFAQCDACGERIAVPMCARHHERPLGAPKKFLKLLDVV